MSQKDESMSIDAPALPTDLQQQSSPDDGTYQAGAPPTAGNLPAGVIVSVDTERADRIPPGQVRTRKWPVLHATTVPEIDLGRWELTVSGLVERPLRIGWNEFLALPRVRVFADFHCVTRWSRLGNLWEGVSVRELLKLANVSHDARFVIIGGADADWTTNLPIDEFSAPDALLADRHDGRPLHPDHGGPLRLIVPRLYAWKSAKWVNSIRLTATDEPGLWERAGYHNHGDPWTEERFE